MVFGNKNIEAVGSEVKALTKELQKLGKIVEKNNEESNIFNKEHTKSIRELSRAVESLENKNSGAVNDLEKELKNFMDLNKKLEKRVNAFELLEKNATKKIFDEVSHEVKKQIESLMVTTKRYNELERDLLKTSSSITDLNKNIVILKEISSEIKKADFNLSRHKINLDKADAEKLRLIRENERLMQLIAKERRRK